MAGKTHSARAIMAHPPTGGVNWKMNNVTVQAIKDDELLVEMVATGICHTDIYFSMLPKERGLYPRVLGHEGTSVTSFNSIP
jgi:Zn-dependent alcohol dehydrogenase